LGDVFAVLGVEVRRRMVWPVHEDDDPVESGQARHSAIVSDDPATPWRHALRYNKPDTRRRGRARRFRNRVPNISRTQQI
jgi:hypothetical protein